MIYVILEDHKEREITKIFLRGNENYLCQSEDYELLSLVDTCSYTTFSLEDMSILIPELESIMKSLDSAAIEHVKQIIDLAKKCQAKRVTA